MTCQIQLVLLFNTINARPCMFKETDIKIAFWTNNTIKKLLMHKQQTSSIHSQSVYKLTWPHCSKAYVGQTCRSSTPQFQVHKNAFKTANNSSIFDKHLIEHIHNVLDPSTTPCKYIRTKEHI